MRIFLVSALLASLSAVAAANPAPDVTKMATDDCARARKQNKTCVLSIGAEDVDGKVPTVSDPTIAVPGFHRLDSLIRLRRDFVLEIIKTAEDL
ncbi:MAG: hypothetical protein H6Q90_3326 [Deltaproteobacteria bacterium]|nr:hypothetical protein [Deltaproteobacteria bacterium]